jgi:cytochrome P450
MNDDLLRAEVVRDPFPFYRQLRETSPVHWNTRWNGWVISRYDDVARLLHDSRLSADGMTPYFESLPEASKRTAQPAIDVMRKWIMFMDPPDHTRLRRLLAKALTPRMTASRRPMIEEQTHQLLDRLAGRTEFDLLNDFSYPLPANVTALLLGAPQSELPNYRVWSDDIAQFIHGGIGDTDRLGRATRSVQAFSRSISQLIEARTARREDDLLSAMLDAREADDALSVDEIVAMSILLLVGGHETTQNLLTFVLYLLLTHPDQLELLRSHPELAHGAIEEALRFDGPVRGTTRRVAESFDFEGHRFESGQKLMLLVASANRDPDKFADADEFQIDRQPNEHLAFGYGPHFCVGAALARLEAAVALRVLLDRYSTLTLISSDLGFYPRFVTRAMSMPVVVRTVA